MATILYVDDDPAGRRIFSRLLKILSPNTNLLTASTAEEGLKLASSTSVSCVVLDCRLPDMDGIKAAKKFRLSLPHIPLVLLSGISPEELPEGPFDLSLSKPLSLDALRSILALAEKI